MLVLCFQSFILGIKQIQIILISKGVLPPSTKSQSLPHLSETLADL